jgi:glycerol-3-phosphate cytidylyltransferase
MKTVITYGTYDLLHYGHIELLRRAKELAKGGPLIVAISSDEFNATKGKASVFSFEKRKAMLEQIRCVDTIIREDNWEQKRQDVLDNSVDVFVMGSDWSGKFDDLSDICEVVYLERTPDISSTAIKTLTGVMSGKN